MATRTEKRFGEAALIGTTYVIVGSPVPAATTWNLLLSITNRTAGTAKLRVYIADTSWTTGEPTGGTLKAAIAYDLPITTGNVVQISGVVMNATEKLVVRSDTATSLDVTANGVEIA